MAVATAVDVDFTECVLGGDTALPEGVLERACRAAEDAAAEDPSGHPDEVLSEALRQAALAAATSQQHHGPATIEDRRADDIITSWATAASAGAAAVEFVSSSACGELAPRCLSLVELSETLPGSAGGNTVSSTRFVHWGSTGDLAGGSGTWVGRWVTVRHHRVACTHPGPDARNKIDLTQQVRAREVRFLVNNCIARMVRARGRDADLVPDAVLLFFSENA